MFPVIVTDDGLYLQRSTRRHCAWDVLVFKALSIVVQRERRTDVTVIKTAVIHDLEMNRRQHDDTAP